MAKPRVAFHDFTSCEGCQLQVLNCEDEMLDILGAVDIVNFREAIDEKSEDYDIAFIEGAISRQDEVERLLEIRKKAKVLVAFGSCACFGGVNRMKNQYDLAEANREVYGDHPKETLPVRSVKEIVPVDLEIPGCPVSKDEIERIVRHLAFDVPFTFPAYPVCVECKQRFTTCMLDKGQLCLGTISRAGCTAPCPAGGLPCWGCRGPAEVTNYDEFFEMARRRGFADWEVRERLGFFGGFDHLLEGSR